MLKIQYILHSDLGSISKVCIPASDIAVSNLIRNWNLRNNHKVCLTEKNSTAEYFGITCRLNFLSGNATKAPSVPKPLLITRSWPISFLTTMGNKIVFTIKVPSEIRLQAVAIQRNALWRKATTRNLEVVFCRCNRKQPGRSSWAHLPQATLEGERPLKTGDGASWI